MDVAGEKKGKAITKFRSGVVSSPLRTDDGFTGSRRKCRRSVVKALWALARGTQRREVVASPGRRHRRSCCRAGVGGNGGLGGEDTTIVIHGLAGLSSFFMVEYNFIGGYYMLLH